MRTPHEIGNKIKQQNRIINSKPNFESMLAMEKPNESN